MVGASTSIEYGEGKTFPGAATPFALVQRTRAASSMSGRARKPIPINKELLGNSGKHE
jgi:putative alpha-1,2-mannosidase